MTRPPPDRSPWLIGAAVAALLLLHAGLAVWSVREKSVTADEILHVTGGYFYDRLGDFRLHPENGNLPQRWAALPAVVGGAPAPELAHNPYWAKADAPMIGYAFFYQTGHDHFPMLMQARVLVTVFSLGTGLLVFGWCRRLFGTGAGFFALGLYLLDPNVLAHAALATSDAAATFFLLAACGAFWRHLRAPDLPSGALSALTFGLACVAKYSAVLLLPVFLLLLAWRIAGEEPAARRRWWRLAPLTLAGQAAGALLVIWAFYGFRFSGFAAGQETTGHYLVPWEDMIPRLGLIGWVIDLCRHWHLLPEAFLYGFSWVAESAKTRAAFLAGEYSITGWVRFFPLAFLWKSTLPLLAAVVGGLFWLLRLGLAAPRRLLASATTVAPLLVFFAVYWAFSLTSHLNIGHRHILPTYPVLYILLGGLAALPASRRLRAGFAALLLGGQALACVAVHPHYLAYFNPLAGGPANGWRLLEDSSLDWGQDLPGLAQWLRAHPPGPGEKTYLSYFGSGSPEYYGIAAERLPYVNGFRQARTWCDLHAGLYAISTTMLQQVYSPVRGEWTVALEKEYQDLRKVEPQLREYFLDPTQRPRLVAYAPAVQWERAGGRYDWLRFARLCACLRPRRPAAVIGYSIHVYRLSEADLDRMLNRSYSEWVKEAYPASGRD
jgi:4-amino-4-deoxy-L-arabinose transferase-like glycosyltransferase